MDKRDTAAAFGAEHITLLEVVEKCVVHYLGRNYYNLVGSTIPVYLVCTTSRAIHVEIVAALRGPLTTAGNPRKSFPSRKIIRWSFFATTRTTLSPAHPHPYQGPSA